MYKNIIITAVIIIGFVLLVIFVPKNAGAPTGELTDQTQTFSLEEVAEHATSEDCYSVIDGGVYDLTEFAQQHPGGSEGIIEMCGIDATDIYMNAHGNKRGNTDSLDTFKIGIIEA